MQRIFLVLLTMIFYWPLTGQNIITIQEARQQGAGATVTVQGIVTNGSELGTIRYFQDETGGLAAYSYDLDDLERGDEVVITGTLKDYNELLELDPVTDFEVLSSGNPEPDPVLISPDEMSEDYEGQLIRINGVNFTTSPGGTFGGNQTYNFTAGGQTGTIYVRSNHPLIGEVIPIETVDLIGICSQFYENYQMLLRGVDDIINDATISVVTPVDVTDISTSGFTISWETNDEGTTEAYYGLTPDLELGHISYPETGTLHNLTFSGLDPAQIVYAKAFSVKEGDTAFSALSVFSTKSLSGGEIIAYFTKSVDHSVSHGTDAIWLDKTAADTLIAYIDRARYSIDISIYNFNISQIAGALNDAYDRGVNIRIIYNSESANMALQLLDPGIPRLGSPTGGDYGIMHNKFMIVDAESPDPQDPVVWTGSTNWTTNNMYDDQNNIIILQDQSLARAYTLEFNEMYGSDGPEPDEENAKFGPHKTDNTPHKFVLGDTEVELYFSPSDQTNAQIVKAIEGAGSDIAVATMLITRSDISYALRDMEESGIPTKVIVNSEAECSPLVSSILKEALGFDFRESGEPNTMHNKYLIVDQSNPDANPLVLTGAHNWSNSAEIKNDENTVIVHDAVMANIYYQEFSARFKAGEPLDIFEFENAGKNMLVFPNPAAEQVSVSFEADQPGNAILEIFDLSGRLLMSRTHSTTAGENSINLNISLPEGLYLLTLKMDEQILQQKLVVK